MIIVGAKGFAKEILQVISVDMNYDDESIAFYDNVNYDLPDKLFERFQILKSDKEVEDFFLKTNDNSFVLGLGDPKSRFKMYEHFINLGGVPKTIFSNNTEIGSFDIKIGAGTSIMSGAKISNSVTIGNGCLLYFDTLITHDCKVGNFVEISPKATILGRSKIGDFTSLGSCSIVLPDVTIGNNVIVGAGTLVTKNIPDNCTVVGVPGKIIKQE